MFDIEIEQLIPHRKRMKLIDEVLEIDDQKVITLSIVNERWPLVYNNTVHPIILIEIVAQTAAVVVGNKKLKESSKGASGYLVGIKTADFFVENIPVGSRLECRVNLLYNLEIYGVFTGTVYSGNEIQGKIEIQVFSPEQ